jgi:hypothetical protein
MLKIICPGCGKTLLAKPELAGRTAKCPNCKQPVKIVASTDEDGDSISLDDVSPDQHVIPATEEHLPNHHLPTKLNREYHYLICDTTRVVATWKNDGGAGWQIRAGLGFVPAKRNHDKLPQAGAFQLVELRFAATPDGRRLIGLVAYQLASRWALTSLDEGDDEIAEKITGPGCLNKDQKNAVRQAIKDQFMRPVWQDAAPVVDYLANVDYHSHGVE